MDFMDTVLVIGSGGREHAIVKALLRSDRALCIYAYPGNPGIEADGAMIVEENINSWQDLAKWAKEKEVGLTIVGPEIPLVEGIVEDFEELGLTIFGPSKNAAQIEGSKHFSKNLMKKYNIPTADFESFTDKNTALEYLEKVGAPVVVKASGLAAGKGAIVCDTMNDAYNALSEMFDDKAFGDASSVVIIEEKMNGEEASVFVLTDGTDYKILPISQDHKAIFDGDKGPNTGGMGAYAPAPIVDDIALKDIETKIIKPTLKAMQSEGTPYKGLLYVGVMMTESGAKVVEYNCRFGDPETQAVLPLVDCDWYEVFSACANGNLSDVNWNVKNKHCVTLVLVSEGYPAKYEKGHKISGIEDAEKNKSNVDVYQAGTIKSENGDLLTNGGRVLAVSAWADTLQDAKKIAYDSASKITFKGKTNRNDIADKGIARYNNN